MSKLGKEVSQKTESIPSLPPASAAAAATSADQPMTEEVLSYMFFFASCVKAKFDQSNVIATAN